MTSYVPEIIKARRSVLLAESVRFELTVGRPITSFQDWLLKPLGQLSIAVDDTTFESKSQGKRQGIVARICDFGLDKCIGPC